MTIETRWYQAEAEQALFDFYATPREVTNGIPQRKNALICIPGGAGKSIVIANFFKRALQMHPNTRGIMSTHVKTLIEQNVAKMKLAWPSAPIGIYSAGLHSAEKCQQLIFGGIQSMAKKVGFGFRDFLVIDEAHLVGDEGNYIRFIQTLMLDNPFLKVIGLSATGYRSGLGCLTNGAIFSDVVYDICNIDGFQRLMAEGYLVPLIPPAEMPDGTPLVQIDTTNVGIQAGEFKHGELSAAMKAQNISFPMLKQFVELGKDRASWMFFANGVEEAEEAGEFLNSHFGIPTVVMHSKKTGAENDAALLAWQTGRVRCVVNMGMLTTGVDHPPLDYIGIGRATMSTVLWVQILSRGTRPYDFMKCVNPIVAAAFPHVKNNCLVADFAGNTRRLGPIDNPKLPRARGQKGLPGDAPVKICKKENTVAEEGKQPCSCYNHTTARECFFCGLQFTITDKLSDTASNEQLMSFEEHIIEHAKVDRVIYSRHVKYAIKKANPAVPEYLLPATIKVSYYCGLRTYYEFVTVEGLGGRVNGRDWFRQRHPSEPPANNNEVLKVMGELRSPREIIVWQNAPQNPRVMSAVF